MRDRERGRAVLNSGFLDDETYALIQRSVPIATVDLLCLFSDRSERPLLLIERADGHGQPGLLNLIGGRIRLGESLEAAAMRHLHETLGEAVLVEPRDWGRPEWVAVYPKATTGPGPFDPRQQSISPTYLLRCSGEPVVGPEGEATGLAWFDPEGLPAAERFGFGQAEIVTRLTEALGPSPSA